MDIFEALFLLYTGLLSVPVLVFLLQILAARRVEYSELHSSEPQPRVAVLMPAHDEELVIARALQTLRPQMRAEDTLLVVADNCGDRTAELARAQGAVVVERHDPVKRGKGYALDFGLQFLAQQQAPAVVVIVDADCLMAPGSIAMLARRAMQTARPVQALYLMHAPKQKSMGQAIAEFAWLVKNQVRPSGGLRYGWPCQLMGTGMAFPWSLLRQAELAHGNMVEDMKLGVDLTLAGHAPVFCPQALVTSEFPNAEAVAHTQRTRWEHGHLATILQEVPRLLTAAIRRRDMSLLMMALDLAVPPLSVLALNLLLLLVLSVAGIEFSGFAVWVFIPVWLLNLLFAAAVLSAWYRFGRRILSWQALVGVPVYIMRKIPLYCGFLIKRQQEWVKTDRR